LESKKNETKQKKLLSREKKKSDSNIWSQLTLLFLGNGVAVEVVELKSTQRPVEHHVSRAGLD